MSALNPWTLNDQVEDLANHIKDSFEKCEGSNSLWKYFGLSSTAQPTKEEGSDAKIDFLIRQVEALSEKLNPLDSSSINLNRTNPKTRIGIRSKWQIVQDILKIMQEEEKVKKTQIMQKARLDWKTLNRYFDFLLEEDFITKCDSDPACYLLTEKGGLLLDRLNKVDTLQL